MKDLDVSFDKPLGSGYVPGAENTKDLDNRVNTTFSKKLVDNWLCHHGELTDGDCGGLLEKRHQGPPESPAFKAKIGHLKTRQSYTFSKALKEVGVAIVVWCLHRRVWLDVPFHTMEERLDFWESCMKANPLLVLLMVHYLMGATYSLEFVYSKYEHPDADLNDLKRLHHIMNGKATANICDVVFRAFLNSHEDEEDRADFTFYRPWATKALGNALQRAIGDTEQATEEKIHLDDYPCVATVKEYLRDGPPLFKRTLFAAPEEDAERAVASIEGW